VNTLSDYYLFCENISNIDLYVEQLEHTSRKKLPKIHRKTQQLETQERSTNQTHRDSRLQQIGKHIEKRNVKHWEKHIYQI
jgi:hypothetical protein